MKTRSFSFAFQKEIKMKKSMTITTMIFVILSIFAGWSVNRIIYDVTWPIIKNYMTISNRLAFQLGYHFLLMSICIRVYSFCISTYKGLVMMLVNLIKIKSERK